MINLETAAAETPVIEEKPEKKAAAKAETQAKKPSSV